MEGVWGADLGVFDGDARGSWRGLWQGGLLHLIKNWIFMSIIREILDT